MIENWMNISKNNQKTVGVHLTMGRLISMTQGRELLPRRECLAHLPMNTPKLSLQTIRILTEHQGGRWGVCINQLIHLNYIIYIYIYIFFFLMSCTKISSCQDVALANLGRFQDTDRNAHKQHCGSVRSILALAG